MKPKAGALPKLGAKEKAVIRQKQRKLDKLDWSDDVIEECSVKSSQKFPPPAVENSSSTLNPFVDTMESKIARVQQRKREAEDRTSHKKASSLSDSVVAPSLFESVDAINGNMSSGLLAQLLNDYFDEYLGMNPDFISSVTCQFPLGFYDSSLYNEYLQLGANGSPQDGVCLIRDSSAFAPMKDRGLGIWYPCNVLSYVDGTFSVILSAEAGAVSCSALQVCLLSFTVQKSFMDKYMERVIDALRRRRDSIALMKYHFFIHNMPYSESITSTLTSSQASRIQQRAINKKSLYNVDPSVGIEQMNQVRTEYETVMNKMLFDANMLGKANAEAMVVQLHLPVAAFPAPEKAPKSGLVQVPPHQMRHKVSHFEANSYLCACAGVTSLQGVVAENLSIHGFTIINTVPDRTYVLDRYEAWMADQILYAVRVVRQDWPSKAGQAVRKAVEIGNTALAAELQRISKFAVSTMPTHQKYDVSIRTISDFDGSLNPIKSLLERINFMMGEILTGIVHRSVKEFTYQITELCSSIVTVEDIQVVKVVVLPDSIYKKRVIPPMFTVSFRVTVDDHPLNTEEVEANKQKIEAWKKSKEAANGEKCPIPVVPLRMGKTFEYGFSPDQFKRAILNAFDGIVSQFADVPHVQKYVMEKIYFPVPRVIPTTNVSADSEFVTGCREKVCTSVDTALEPLVAYLALFRKYETFINEDITNLVKSKVTVTRKDPENTEIEMPVTVNLGSVKDFLDYHTNKIHDIEKNFPTTPIEAGLFLIEVASVRQLLLDKHHSIVKLALSQHSTYCQDIKVYLDEEFKKIVKNLSKRPETIEQLVELDDYVSGLGSTIQALQTIITDMMAYHDLLDKYHFKSDFDSGSFKWNIYGQPARIFHKCSEVLEGNISIRKRFKDEMMSEQVNYIKSLAEIEAQVGEFSAYVDLNDVVNIAAKVKEMEGKLAIAQSKARLFNSRESLFEMDVTDYEDLARINKAFEPYANLWTTARDWQECSKRWMNSRFIDIDYEEVERNVDRFNVAINKAAKFFAKADMADQSGIANLIKTQVQNFMPEVPLIVTLRNPGMRDRHWEKIATALNVEIMPIENFTTEQIIAMNLKENLDLIQKIGESAAKEYQIESALNKMEAEWETMMLQIHPYKESTTGVLKGVEDLTVVLDEQITMTQAIMFSAFKGPFEERIDEWNRKLCCVSDVLEKWMVVQKNWLYLQPIFESGDINRQLPTEGKKFASVDKNWRNTIAMAKQQPKAIDFCDNEKLLKTFCDSEILLDEVQKGLSDYLETKRSHFARFYFLSNDELLSIVSESKDVKLVQPHLKKCFEGIDKVNFMPDLKIDKMVSPEDETVILSTIVNPVNKNVEHWMLELEGVMRVTIRDVMKASIEDYTKTPRPKWMQKWPGMCVLNGSQMHWTTEMEQLFAAEGIKGPATMFDRQVAQLADMTVLVRGPLSKSARVTVGALTVIDVHAREVIRKLVEENVETKDNFAWTSQLRYYWDGELTAQMVAATRPYGYEYLGNTFRLVITPLTDKCYLTLMGALQMIFGGAPAGPAGTGKTETTKDLAKALAMQCVVFNCSDGLDYLAMGKFFKGLASCGAWACFDEFNRINIEVLSVIGQQIMSIQMVVRAKETRMNFEGSDIVVSDKFAVFITMNPGYAGRSALPDSLQALFRPVAMM
jgi:dynein heavy chain